MELGEAIASYLSERRRNHSLAPPSLNAARHVLWNVQDRFGAGCDPATIRPGDIGEWLASYTCGPTTKRSYASHARGLFRWLVVRGDLDRDPFVGVELPPKSESVPRALEPDQVAAIFAACNDAREVLIALLGVQEGLRASEVARLQLGDVSAARGSVFVHQSKGRKDRIVPLTDETRQALSDYRSVFGIVGAGPVIRSKRNPNVGIGRDHIVDVMGELMYRAGIKERARDGVSFHALRHTAATDVLVAADYDIRPVKEFLGHRSLATTEVYLKGVAADRLRSVVNGRTYRPAL